MSIVRTDLAGSTSVSLSFANGHGAVEPFFRHEKLGGGSPDGCSIAVTNYYIEIDGRPALPVMGEFHFSRYPHRYWEDALRAIKSGGIDIVSTYVFWIHHEEREGVLDWTEDLNLRAFIQACARVGLRAVVRIGPFAHGECRNGGLPDWLYGRAFNVRSTNPEFLSHVQSFYAAIAAQLTGLLFKDGGPVIGIQLDNEYMHAGAPWEVTYRQGTEWVPAGDEGTDYMWALKTLALAAGLDVPLYTCTGWIGSPVVEGEMLPVQGGYAFTPWIPDPDYVQPPTPHFLFDDRHKNPVIGGAPTYDASRYPYACCELGGGIQITYHHRPVVPAACVEAQAVVALGSGTNLLGYYMYHGGTQRVTDRGYTNEYSVPRLSYDFQAPVREFGQLNQSYHALKLIHIFLHAFGQQLAPLHVVLPDARPRSPHDTDTLRVAARADRMGGFLFLTNYQDHVDMRDHQDVTMRIHAGDEEIVLPREHGLCLPRDASVILPINLMLGTVRLVYATAQPLTRLASEHGDVWVFFAAPGTPVEYAFARDMLRDVEAPGIHLYSDEERLYATVEPGGAALLTLTALDGTVARILTLTRAQALRAWTVMLEGEARLVLSEAMVVEDGECLRITSQDGHEGAIGLVMYPPLAHGLETADGRVDESADTIFARYTIPIPATRMPVEIAPLPGRRYLLRVPGGIPVGAEDVLLRIRYDGDIGEAYLGGTLINDNFYNGEPWEIGLKRFADCLEAHDLLIRIVPRHDRGHGPQYEATGMASRLAGEDGGIGIIHTVEAIAEYRIAAWARRGM
jgi:beta-galactosidase